MTSKRQRNAGYLLPTPVTGYDTICLTLQIPNERRYRAAVIGQLYQLANWWMWEKSYLPGDERAKEAANMFRRLLVDTLMLQECGSGGTPVTTPSGCVPIGSPFMLFVPTAPEGALPMDGAQRLQADYPDLMPMIPATWKIGDYFYLPNMTTKTLVGAGQWLDYNTGQPYTMPGGGSGGEKEHLLSIEEMPSHSHRISHPADPQPRTSNRILDLGTTSDIYEEKYSEAVGGGEYHNNMPPFVAGYWFIQATNCTSEAAGDFDIRLSGCLLEYTLNGSMWFVVDGWTNYDNCLSIPLPFDLRFNNCLLEYSRDSAQTWATVPGWDDLAACLPDTWGPEDFNMRVEGGVLQYTEDGGDTWNPVFNWNSLQDSFVREGERCLNAQGVSTKLFEYLSQVVGNLAAYEPADVNGFKAAMTAWYNSQQGFPPLPEHLVNVVWENMLFNYSSAQLAGQTTEANRLVLAEAIYAKSINGEWCDDQYAAIDIYLSCLIATGTDTEWLLICKQLIDEWLTFAEITELRATLFRMRDYGTCGPCNAFDDVGDCSMEQTLIYDFETSDEGWEFASGVVRYDGLGFSAQKPWDDSTDAAVMEYSTPLEINHIKLCIAATAPVGQVWGATLRFFNDSTEIGAPYTLNSNADTCGDIDIARSGINKLVIEVTGNGTYTYGAVARLEVTHTVSY